MTKVVVNRIDETDSGTDVSIRLPVSSKFEVEFEYEDGIFGRAAHINVYGLQPDPFKPGQNRMTVIYQQKVDINNALKGAGIQ
jgi:hypothetical protein